jgi:hypothetical protein
MVSVLKEKSVLKPTMQAMAVLGSPTGMVSVVLVV